MARPTTKKPPQPEGDEGVRVDGRGLQAAADSLSIDYPEGSLGRALKRCQGFCAEALAPSSRLKTPTR